MTKLNCESVCMAAMAIADSYQSELSSDQIEAHLAECTDCRHEVGQLRDLLNSGCPMLRLRGVLRGLGVHLYCSVCYCSVIESSR